MVGSLEGWLVLVIFLGVAILVVERIETSLTQARQSIYMYELCSALSDQRTRMPWRTPPPTTSSSSSRTDKVSLIYQPKRPLSPNIVVSQPSGADKSGRPDRVLPLLNSWGLVGEIQIWRGGLIELPPEESPLLQNLANQTARALERTRSVQIIGNSVPSSPNI